MTTTTSLPLRRRSSSSNNNTRMSSSQTYYPTTSSVSRSRRYCYSTTMVILLFATSFIRITNAASTATDEVAVAPTHPPPGTTTEEIEVDTFIPDPNAPITFCLGGCPSSQQCVGNQNHPQGISDTDCTPCSSGQTFWPCDTEGLCFCWDPATDRIPPAPGSGLALHDDAVRPCEYFTESIFNTLAPEAKEPYTYEGLCDAIDNYNAGHAEKIFMMGTEQERKSEFAAFLGNTLHESDEWKAAREYLICGDNKDVNGEVYCKPCDTESFDWETFTCNGPGLAGPGSIYNGYCDYTIMPPIACPCDGELVGDDEGYISASKVFFGRGAIQLSWNYNFRAASEALTGNSKTFCDNPDLVATTPKYAWGAGIFFWMENLKEETTCHIESMRNLDFGGILNNINGGLECPAYHGGWHGEAVKLRLNRYCKASTALGLDVILTFAGCKGLNDSFVECLGDGTCPDCELFASGDEPIILEREGQPAPAPAEEEAEDTSSTTETTPAPQPDVDEEVVDGVFPGGDDTEDEDVDDAEVETSSPTPAPQAVDDEEVVAESTSVEEEEKEEETDAPSPSVTDKKETDSPTSTVTDKKETDSPTSTVAEESDEPTSIVAEETDEPTATVSEEGTDSQSLTVAVESNAPTAAATDKEEEEEEEDEEQDEEGETSSSACPEGMSPVDGLPDCCVPEPLYHGDGACDPNAPLNTAECAYDGGDCCREMCDVDSTYKCSTEPSEYGPFGFFCIDPAVDEEYIDPEVCTVSDRTKVGDGLCDAGVEMYNTEACNWDGGDCCAETCNDEYSHFDCGSPKYPYDCQNPAFSENAAIVATDDDKTESPVSAPDTEIEMTELPTSAPLLLAPTSVEIEDEDKESMPSQEIDPYEILIVVSDDATITKSSPDSNYGLEPTLKVKKSDGPFGHDAALRFIIPEYDFGVLGASLKLYSLTKANDGGHIAAMAMASSVDPWSESSVTWNDTPESGDMINSIGAIQADEWITIDMTAVVSSLEGKEGAVTIRISSTDPRMVEYSSKEGLHPPEMVIQYDGVPTLSSVADPKSAVAFSSTSANLTTTPSTVVSDDIVFFPSDDATIVEGHPDENYGLESTLQIDDDSGTYDSLLKFDLSEIDTSSVASATLRLFCMDGSDAGGIFGKTRASNWKEASVTWNSAPAAYGSPFHNLGSVKEATWYEIDVTEAFFGETISLNVVSIRITSKSWDRASYSSKQGSNPPELVIKMKNDASMNVNESVPTTTSDLIPSTSGVAASSGSGLFFPIWRSGGSVACVNRASSPSWATGAYLKESKADCCQAYSVLQLDECLAA